MTRLAVWAELVELKAKSASLFPCALGFLWVLWSGGRLDFLRSALLLIAILLFNCAVDIWDNYCDYKRPGATEDYRARVNIIGRENLNPLRVRCLALTYSGISAIIGLTLLALGAAWPLLPWGLFSFAVGFFYSGGPRPLSGLPVGEFFSGFTMGLVIPLISAGVNDAAIWALGARALGLWFYCLPTALAISSLMLANNVADWGEDRQHGRRTLPICVGCPAALILLRTFTLAIYVLALAAFLILQLKWPCLLILLTAPLVGRNVAAFSKNPDKSQRFRGIALNLALVSIVQVLGLALSLIF